jgi:predicted NAD/FAD-binding protein
MDGDGSEEMYNGCILAVHAPDALRILGDQVTFDEKRILGAFQYVYRYIHSSLYHLYLHMRSCRDHRIFRPT